MLVRLGRGQVGSCYNAGNRLQWVRFTGGDDPYPLRLHALRKPLTATGRDQNVQIIQGMATPTELVHGHLFWQVQAVHLSDFCLPRLVNQEAPGLSRMTGDCSEILTGYTYFHRILRADMPS